MNSKSEMQKLMQDTIENKGVEQQTTSQNSNEMQFPVYDAYNCDQTITAYSQSEGKDLHIANNRFIYAVHPREEISKFLYAASEETLELTLQIMEDYMNYEEEDDDILY
ncbi:MAG: hypothetical protein EZS28_005558 [Streblomastix strix]|uniref:Uncharacterized protein n=1 Tax=Streblomastix strix TaxID=222440 RepID=A0A5J4WVF2_9EUKA|nr:MAG: hypothetical protein EZS28_005558 [Streblomastix strix]